MSKQGIEKNEAENCNYGPNLWTWQKAKDHAQDANKGGKGKYYREYC